eukprot:SAG31_NODE_562_length_14085_cov_164.582869_10_plen_178_part_00
MRAAARSGAHILVVCSQILILSISAHIFLLISASMASPKDDVIDFLAGPGSQGGLSPLYRLTSLRPDQWDCPCGSTESGVPVENGDGLVGRASPQSDTLRCSSCSTVFQTSSGQIETIVLQLAVVVPLRRESGLERSAAVVKHLMPLLLSNQDSSWMSKECSRRKRTWPHWEDFLEI